MGQLIRTDGLGPGPTTQDIDWMARAGPAAEPPAVPAWVHRLHADGLARKPSSRLPLLTGSQWPIERWDRVLNGY